MPLKQDQAQRLYDRERFDEAAGICRELLRHNPGDLNAMHLLGLVHLRRSAAAEAVPLLTAVARARPDAGVMNDLGFALATLSRVDEAVEQFRSALALQPDCLPAIANLANALLEQGNQQLADDNLDAAESCYREAMALRPGFSEAAANLATVLVAQNRLREGIGFYHAALAWQPGYANTEFALSLALLLDGAFAEGWRYCAARQHMPAKATTYQRRLDVPRCRPEDLLSLPAGTTILLLAEQGFGDMIQFARYVPLLQQRGLRVILEAQPELHALFRAMPAVTVIGPNDPAPPCDAAIFLLSLPQAFATDLTNVPANVPYMRAQDDRVSHWHASLGAPTGRRIGLAVSGDPAHPHDRQRSLPLAALAPILAVPDCQFVLLQRDVRDADRAMRDATPTLLAPALQDFADTGALLSQLDLLITVDTSVAHLAGALGVPVWLMLRFSPDYRWLLGRNDSPWYPTMRLYRQPRPGDWDAVIAAVRRDLSGRR